MRAGVEPGRAATEIDEFKTEELVKTGSASTGDVVVMLKSRHITPFVSTVPANAIATPSLVYWLARR